MKATGSASLLSRAPSGFCSHPSGSSYFCKSWHLESGRKGGKEKKKGEGKEEARTQRQQPLTFFFHQVAPTGQHRIMQRGRTTKEGQKCRARKMPKEKSTEVRPVEKVDLCSMGSRWLEPSNEGSHPRDWNGITLCHANQSSLILPLVATTSPLPCLLCQLHSFGSDTLLLWMRCIIHRPQRKKRMAKNKKVHFLLLNF